MKWGLLLAALIALPATVFVGALISANFDIDPDAASQLSIWGVSIAGMATIGRSLRRRPGKSAPQPDSSSIA